MFPIKRSVDREQSVFIEFFPSTISSLNQQYEIKHEICPTKELFRLIFDEKFLIGQCDDQ